jgi:hypothetical protein
MDIGVPLRDLGKVDVGPLLERIATLTEPDWERNSLRQDALANGAHDAAQNILFKYDWGTGAATTSIRHFEDVIWLWAKNKGIDPAPFMPIEKRANDVRSVFTFPDYLRFQDVLDPLVEQVLARLGKPGGMVTRLALVRLKPGVRIEPHIDAHDMAARAHRLHVSLSNSPSVVYKIGGRKLVMQLGHVYDFNNRVRHSVRNEGRSARTNLFVDYYPSPGIAIANPLHDLPPLFAPATPRAR